MYYGVLPRVHVSGYCLPPHFRLPESEGSSIGTQEYNLLIYLHTEEETSCSDSRNEVRSSFRR